MGKTARYALLRTLPVMAGYLVLGLGFGGLLQSKGYGLGWALAMSLLVYAGSMQYVAVELLAGAAVVGLQLWRKNTLLSIAAGTALYVVLVQTVFK